MMSIPMIKAVGVHQYGGPEQLKVEQIPRPNPSAGEVLVRVYAAGVLTNTEFLCVLYVLLFIY